MGQYVMRSLNAEGLLDFGVGRKEQIKQDVGGDEEHQQKVCIGRRENSLLGSWCHDKIALKDIPTSEARCRAIASDVARFEKRKKR